MPSANKLRLVTNCSTAMREHLELFAAARDISIQKLLREALSVYTGYTLTPEDDVDVDPTRRPRGKPHTYRTDEERMAARREQQNRRQMEIRQAVADARERKRAKMSDNGL